MDGAGPASDADGSSDVHRAFSRPTPVASAFGALVFATRQPAFEARDPGVPHYALIAADPDPAGATGVAEVDVGFGWQRSPVDPGRGRAASVIPAMTEVASRATFANHIAGAAIPAPALDTLLRDHGLPRTIFDALAGVPRHEPTLSRLVREMVGCAAHHGPAGALLFDGLLMQFVALAALRGGRPDLSGAAPGIGDLRLARVVEYVDAHLAGRLTVRDLAEVACVSPFHFSRIFREALGRTPHDYVMERRTERAKRMLRAGTDTPAQIAFACGFASQSHMTDVFRARVGVPPARYRQLARG